MDKDKEEDVYDGILLSHKKGQNWGICTDVDEPEVYHRSEVSQKEKQMPYVNAYTWNLEKWNRFAG